MARSMEQHPDDIERQLDSPSAANSHITDTDPKRLVEIPLRDISRLYLYNFPHVFVRKECWVNFKDITKEGAHIFRSLQIAELEDHRRHRFRLASTFRKSSSFVDEALIDRLRSNDVRAVVAENLMWDDISCLGTVLEIDPRFIAQHIEIFYRPTGIGSSLSSGPTTGFNNNWMHLIAVRDNDSCLGFQNLPNTAWNRPLISIYQRSESSYFVMISTTIPYDFSTRPGNDISLVQDTTFLLGNVSGRPHCGLADFMRQCFETALDRSIFDHFMQALPGSWEHHHKPSPIMDRFCVWLNLKIIQCVVAQMKTEVEWFADGALDQPDRSAFKILVWARKVATKLKAHLLFSRRTSVDVLTTELLAQVPDMTTRSRDPEGGEAPMSIDAGKESASVVGHDAHGVNLDDMETSLEAISVALHESYDPLIGAITVQDSAANKEQAYQAKLLTLLAAIYLPATLATGIFGMNIAEISGDRSAPKFWAAVATFAALFTPSFVFVLYIFRAGIREKMAAARKSLASAKVVVVGILKLFANVVKELWMLLVSMVRSYIR